MTRSSSIKILADICGQEWFLAIEFDYNGGASAVMPLWNDPGSPAEGSEISITKIEWAEAIKPLPRFINIEGEWKVNLAKPKPGPEWTEITGPLFDFLAADEWVLGEIDSHMEDDGADDF